MTNASSEPDWGRCLGRCTLIVGDVNTGKTTLARKLLDQACSELSGDRIAIVDLAPDIPPDIAARRGLSGVGGRLTPPTDRGVLYLNAPIEPPRLSSATEAEARAKAEANAVRIERLFLAFERSGRNVLFVNDLSMYVQAGSSREVIRVFDRAATVVANGYFGEKLGSGGLSRRERREMERLMEHCDHVWRL
ncbi:MAG: ATP-binding protein [Proteobacteria bacterium]|nr:ATP-binding protein [Pseudomonadota bacterium]